MGPIYISVYAYNLIEQTYRQNYNSLTYLDFPSGISTLEYAANPGVSTFTANFISELWKMIFSMLHKKVDLNRISL